MGVLWAFGTWWIPLLVILGLWRHVRHHWPLTYEPTLWSVVFPLGMYSVATLTFGKAAGLTFTEPLSRFMLWVAVGAWVLVAAAFLARLGRQRGAPAPGPPTTSSPATAATPLPGRPADAGTGCAVARRPGRCLLTFCSCKHQVAH